MRANYRPEVFTPPDAPPALASLQASGFVLGVVSNRDTAYESELQELGLSPYIQFSLAAGEVGAYKPAAEIFRRAVELSGTEAHQAMYVGDNYFADVVGARDAGLKPVLYDPSDTFPGADCTTIHSFSELTEVVEKYSSAFEDSPGQPRLDPGPG
jgi:putative hydrolase of the HAD superfamily